MRTGAVWMNDYRIVFTFLITYATRLNRSKSEFVCLDRCIALLFQLSMRARMPDDKYVKIGEWVRRAWAI